MKIAIIGAAGNLGSRTVAEALRRRHQVTPLTRAEVEATDAEAVAAAVADHDVTVGATRPVPGHEDQAAVITRALLTAHARAHVRFILVGGAGSLQVPGSDTQLVADDERWVPARIRDLAHSAIDQLDLCRQNTETDWTYITPPVLMLPGQRTGTYRTGDDEILTDNEGNSYISMEDMAVAILDEIESPAHQGRRFTVACSSSGMA